jgi:hypothetical protein
MISISLTKPRASSLVVVVSLGMILASNLNVLISG